MKLFLFLTTLLTVFLSAEKYDAQKILKFSESGDDKNIQKIFESTPSLKIAEGNSFLNQLSGEIHKKFGSGFNFDDLQESLWNIIDSEKASESKKLLVKDFFSNIFEQSFCETSVETPRRFYLPNHFEQLALGIRIHPFIWANWTKAEVPSGVVIGAVETLAGALLWVTPFRTVGTGMMIDGVRRMLNAVDEESYQRDQAITQNRFSDE